MKLIAKRQMAMVVAMLMIPMGARAYEEVEDLVEIFATDDNYVAMVDGRSNFSESISSGEHILWQGAKGEVGAFLTSKRLLAVTITSGHWNKLDLKINEKQKTPDMLLAAHLVVMLTDERIVTFGTHTDGFFQTRLPIGESTTAKEAEGRVAAVVTPTRAYGFSAYRRGVSEFRFRRQETLVSLKTTYNKITMQTSDRVVALDAEDAVWREFELK
jgi:hypothetical protein